jgi:hypothetical protein
MAVIVLDRAWLSSSMQPLAQHQRGAFAASCVQRLAPGFLTAQRSAQWECRGAYQTDALAAMLYAGRSWEPSPTSYVLQCTQRAFTRRRSWTGSLLQCRRRTRWRTSAR